MHPQEVTIILHHHEAQEVTLLREVREAIQPQVLLLREVRAPIPLQVLLLEVQVAVATAVEEATAVAVADVPAVAAVAAEDKISNHLSSLNWA